MSSDNSHDEFLTGARKLLGKRPIMAGEDPADYGLLMKLVSRDVRPQDLREWLLVKDIVDSEWEVLRLRGLKVTMLHAMVPRAVRAQMFRHGASFPELVQPLRAHIVDILAGDPAAREKFGELLKVHGLTLDVTIAAAFEQTIVAQSHTDRMAAAAYDRRNKAYAELERIRGGKLKLDEELGGLEEIALDEVAEGAPPTAPDGGGLPEGPEFPTISDARAPAGRRLP